MDEELNEKIKQISEALGQEVPDNIGDIISSVLSSDAVKENMPDSPEDPGAGRSSSEEQNSANQENIEMALKIQKIVSRLNNKSDPKIKLLYALEPFLSDSRKLKLKSCEKMLKLAQVKDILKDMDINLFG